MTDKNRDVSQIRVGIVTCPDCNGTGENGYRYHDGSPGMCGECKGTGSISQPEEQPVADQASVRARVWNVCRKCGRGETETYQPCPPDREDVEQWQKDQKEYFQANVREIVGEYAEWRDRQDALKLTEAEKRGDAAGYARRVAEEGGEAVGEVVDCSFLGGNVIVAQLGKGLVIGAKVYTAPQPDTRDGTIAELLAKAATLREALKWIAESVPFVDGAMSLRRRATNALAATGDE